MNDQHSRLRDILEERGLTHLFESEETDGVPCPGCGGKGKYVGFRTIEDPCETCDGDGRISQSQMEQERER